jgi:hypothetical protein
MSEDSRGVTPADLDDDDLRRELKHLHDTRHDTVLAGSQSALENHTQRMLALESEFLHRFPLESAPQAQRTRAGSRDAAGQEVPGRDVSAAPAAHPHPGP